MIYHEEFESLDNDLNGMADPDDSLYRVLYAMRQLLWDLDSRVTRIEDRLQNAGIKG